MKSATGTLTGAAESQNLGGIYPDRRGIKNNAYKHGHSIRGQITFEYRVWAAVMNRCTNRMARSFPKYGGAGITVCERWHSFENFFADMGKCPEGLTSIDRFPNKAGNYEPGNCRWANDHQQSRNQKSNSIYEYNGESRCLAEWAELHSMPYHCVWQRIMRLGWDIGKALTTPVRPLETS